MDLSLRATVATECQPDLSSSKPSQARGGEFGIINNRCFAKKLWVAAELHRLYVDYYVTM